MPILDPSIALQAQAPQLMSPAQVIQLKSMVEQQQYQQMQMEEAKRQKAAREAVLNIYREDGAIDPNTHLPTAATAERVMQTDPQSGLALRKALDTHEEKRAALAAHVATFDKAKLDMSMKKSEVADTIFTKAWTAYDGARKGGMAESQAIARGQEALHDQFEEARKSGLFSEDELRKFNTSFEPGRIRSALVGSAQFKQVLDQENRDRTAKTEEAKAAEMKRYHDLRLAQGKKGEGAPLTDIAKLNADFAAGRITKEQYDDATRKKTGSKAGLTVADKMNPVMLATVRFDIKEMENALTNMEKGVSDVAGPFFADKEEGNALTRVFKKSMTPENQQMFDVAANRVSSALASVQSMGRGMISDEKVRQAQKMVPVIGDTEKVRRFKLEQLRKFGEYAKEILSSPIKEGARDTGDDLKDVLDFWEK